MFTEQFADRRVGGDRYRRFDAESVNGCDEDIAAYTAIRTSLAKALHNGG